MLRYRLIHTGQHYDPRMSGEFFRQLGIPEPDVNLEVGSGTQAEQTGAIMSRYEALLLDAPSNLCLVVGDVTSTMACAIAARRDATTRSPTRRQRRGRVCAAAGRAISARFGPWRVARRGMWTWCRPMTITP